MLMKAMDMDKMIQEEVVGRREGKSKRVEALKNPQI